MESTPGTFEVNPGATWKPSPPGDTNSASLVSVDLTRLNNGQPVPAGSSLDVTSAGSFYFNSVGDLSSVATGVFVNAAGSLLAPNPVGSTVGPTSSTLDCNQLGLPDAVPEDFTIPSDRVATVVVPVGATAMRLSVSDCYYQDNRKYSADPIRITITLK
jgi:hypothetical protein